MRIGAPSRRLAQVAVLGVVVLLSFSPASRAQSQALAGGRALANLTWLRIDDPGIFLEETIFAPPEVMTGYADAEVDRAGLASARSASGYSEYMNLLGAVPELGPAVLPPDLQFLFFALLEVYPPGLAEDFGNLTQASVQGQPPQQDSATVGPPGPTSGGIMTASLDEGPEATAFSSFADLPLSALLDVDFGESESTVSTDAAGSRQAVAHAVLRNITIGGIIDIDAIDVTATATADGGQGVAETDVVVEGVSVAGIPAVIDHEGLRVADSVSPLSTSLLNQAIAALGVTITGPGEAVTERTGEEARAVATGPSITIETAQGQSVVFTLGRAVALSNRAEITFTAPPAPTGPPPSVDTPPSSTPPGGGSVDVPTTSPPTTGGPQPPVVQPDGEGTSTYALDRDRLLLARDGAPQLMVDLYTMLVIGASVLGAWGAIRPWRES